MELLLRAAMAPSPRRLRPSLGSAPRFCGRAALCSGLRPGHHWQEISRACGPADINRTLAASTTGTYNSTGKYLGGYYTMSPFLNSQPSTALPPAKAPRDAMLSSLIVRVALVPSVRARPPCARVSGACALPWRADARRGTRRGRDLPRRRQNLHDAGMAEMSRVASSLACRGHSTAWPPCPAGLGPQLPSPMLARHGDKAPSTGSETWRVLRRSAEQCQANITPPAA